MAITDQQGSEPLIVRDFSGGMHLDGDLSAIKENEYALLINGRSRNNRIIPVNLPLLQPNLPSGNYQGGIGLGSVMIIMINGRAYYKDYATSSNSFNPIPGFTPMDVNTDHIYMCSVPASTQNYKRELITATRPASGVNLTNGVTGTPKVVVCQDAISSPRLILSQNLARIAHSFLDWSWDDPEYVPKGRQMMSFNNKLYIVSVDGTEIFDSVSGRPLDFVKAIDDAGNKLATEYPEEASRVSHKVDYNAITCIAPLSIRTDSGEPAGFFVSTGSACWMVTADNINLLYGEPTYRNIPLFPTGALNHFSFTELLGDQAFIDTTGIKLFNAISQYQNEGKQSPISVSVAPLFDGIIQSYTAATLHDNYGLFAVDTVYGPAILVYDCVTQKFVSLDIYPFISYIKQFITLRVVGEWRLFFITSDGLYEAYAGTTASMRWYPREWATGNCDYEHRLNRVRLVIRNIQEAGRLSITDYADSRTGETLYEDFEVSHTPTYPKTLPFGNGAEDKTENPTFPFSGSKKCFNIGVEIEMPFKGEITQVQVSTETIEELANDQTQAKVY